MSIFGLTTVVQDKQLHDELLQVVHDEGHQVVGVDDGLEAHPADHALVGQHPGGPHRFPRSGKITNFSEHFSLNHAAAMFVFVSCHRTGF